MSVGNGDGVIRIGRKGIKKFAFGDDGAPFEVDVVRAFQEWLNIDEQHRQTDGDKKGMVLPEDMPAYHQAAVDFANGLSNTKVTVAEALDFKARLCEQYEELADFFRPKRRGEDESPGTSGAALQFSAEEEP